MTPVSKNNEKSELGHYRQIFIILVFSQILGKTYVQQGLFFLKNKAIWFSEQHLIEHKISKLAEHVNSTFSNGSLPLAFTLIYSKKSVQFTRRYCPIY